MGTLYTPSDLFTHLCKQTQKWTQLLQPVLVGSGETLHVELSCKRCGTAKIGVANPTTAFNRHANANCKAQGEPMQMVVAVGAASGTGVPVCAA